MAGAEGERGLLIAALYARVSTDIQERNETIASQLDALQRAAAEGGYAAEGVFEAVRLTRQIGWHGSMPTS